MLNPDGLPIQTWKWLRCLTERNTLAQLPVASSTRHLPFWMACWYLKAFWYRYEGAWHTLIWRVIWAVRTTCWFYVHVNHKIDSRIHVVITRNVSEWILLQTFSRILISQQDEMEVNKMCFHKANIGYHSTFLQLLSFLRDCICNFIRR